jgi:hypothetical protein
MRQELRSQSPDTLGTRERAAQFWGSSLRLLPSGSNAHPPASEVTKAHAVTVVGHLDAVIGDQQLHQSRIRVIRVLDQLSQRDMRSADQPLAQFTQELGVDGECLDGQGEVLFSRAYRSTAPASSHSPAQEAALREDRAPIGNSPERPNVIDPGLDLLCHPTTHHPVQPIGTYRGTAASL